MGTKHSKSEDHMNTEEEEESDDESEILEIMQEEACSEEGEVNLEAKYCEKKEVHKNYIPIKNLTLTLLKDRAESIYHESLLRYIQLRAQLVVQIKVSHTSTSRPANDKFSQKERHYYRNATGYAWIYCGEQSEVPCPDKLCSEDKKRPHNVYRGILITTNKHVIFDNDEAQKAEVKFFYDDEDAAVIKGHGYALREELEQKDYVSLKIYHHCDFLFQKINEINEQIMRTWENIPQDIKVEMEKHTIVISHPHGRSKIVTIGELLNKEVLEKDEESKTKYRKVTRYTSTTCPGSSGAPVLTGLYWTNPFVHSSCRKEKIKKSKTFIGLSFSY